MGKDSIIFGGKKIKNVIFGEALQVNSLTFIFAKFDGILGMGFKSLSREKTSPIFYLMYQQKLIEDNSFSFYLTRTPDSSGSKLILGGISKKYAVSNFNYHKVIHTSYW